MKKLGLLFVTLMVSNAFASEGDEIIKSIGKVYRQTEGSCAEYLDIMRWFDYDQTGYVSFAIIDRPNVRPLTGYSLMATMSAKHIAPVGKGEFKMHANQPVPLKAEYQYHDKADLSLYFHHQGKGSPGSIFYSDYPGYPGENRKFEYDFSKKNENGIYENVTMIYKNLKGLFPKKARVCKFKLEE